MPDVEPVSSYPPASSRTLEQWLDPVFASQIDTEVQTRLRQIAQARAMRAGMWSAFLSLGVSTVVFVAVVYAVNRDPRVLIWAVGGTIAVLGSVLMMRRGRRIIPKPGASLTTRGPGDLSGGILAAVGIFLVVNVLMLPGAVNAGQILPMVFLDLGLLLLLVSTFVVPAAVIGRANSTLRRDVQSEQRLVAALGQERLAWTPRGAVAVFGPL